MADVVLTVAKTLVEGTLSKAQIAIEEEEKLRKRAQRDLVFIAGEFQMMQSFLSTTTKENVKNIMVSTCVTQVRDLAYDVEDCIEYILHLDTKPDWWCRMVPSCMAPSRPLDEAVDILEHLKGRVQDLGERSSRYKLISEDSGSNLVNEMGQLATAGSSELKQRDMDALTKLVTKSGSDREVISVWAFGDDLGAASKSIIRKAFKNTKIWGNFSCRAWVAMGNSFDLRGILRSLNDQFSGAVDDQASVAEDDLEHLRTKVKDQVNREKYLIILEDLSTKENWADIQEYLPDRSNGSRIVVLTQQFQVASSCTGFPYIQCFWDDYPLCVFSKGNEGPLLGRISEINKLPNYSSIASANGSRVLSMWGTAGAGKSAFVRNLCCNMLHSKKYKRCVWMDASRSYSLTDLSRNQFSSLHPYCLFEANEAISTGEEIGIGDPVEYLVVIDNLESTEKWDSIRNALVSRPSKSVIIVITNDESIALHCADKKELVFNVRCLEVRAAIELFKKELRPLILKCGGLPKVIVAVADYLSQHFNWEEKATTLNDQFVNNLETWPEFASLADLFSWMHSYLGALPEPVRQHVAYLLIFPGQSSIRRRRLLMRWVAEGYSRDSDSCTANENAEKHFSKLVQLSMVHRPLLTTITHMRMVSYEVSNIFHEYMVTRPSEENIATAIEIFELNGICSPTSRRRGRHLVIGESWDRDRIVFKNIDFSRLRSLTVFGKWEKFFITESMKVLRVLDLEDASGVTDKDLQSILKLLRRLKFLSLRGCSEIKYLPSSVGELRQLQILDVRYTKISKIPTSITNLKKLQYMRVGPTVPPVDQSAPHTVTFKMSELRRCLHLVGVEVMSGIGELTALHTLGVINIGVAGGKVILKELRKLTQLRKLGVSGVSKKNVKELSSAILCHSRLESLSVWLNKHNQDCMDGMFPENTNETSGPEIKLQRLQSFKLYGLGDKLPEWINQLDNLRKLVLEMTTLPENTFSRLRDLKVCILRLYIKKLPDGKLNFCVMLNGAQLRCFETVKVLEISCYSSMDVTFGSRALQNLELLKASCCSGSGSVMKFSGLEHLSELKEVQIKGSHDGALQNDVEGQLSRHKKNPVLKME
ncbi:hypothetical protein GQ55_8G079000 [Panicum hallii var. hallii]|uniref:NB-ARC domain-containing protein n=1 Tax=Panicum hallii var. hallii TaxID=1504633 RepID=A0A2T7CLX2_9POAL|nr:hypothetical protein GQ55_8G079000 [Panicum hallii var. hallii]